MSDVNGLSANAELGIKVDAFLKGINEAITKLGEFSEENNHSLTATEKLEQALVTLAKQAKNLGKAIDGGTQSKKADVDVTKKLTKEVEGLTDAEKRLAQVRKELRERSDEKTLYTKEREEAQARAENEKRSAKERADSIKTYLTYEEAVTAELKKQHEEKVAAAKVQLSERADEKVIYSKDRDETAAYAENARRNKVAESKANAEAIKQETAAQSEYAKQLKVTEEYYANMASTRYALYDVAATWTVVAGATLGAEIAALKLYATYDKMMSQIERTSELSESPFSRLQKDLDTLYTSIPITMESLGEIATLAGQLGIAGDAIDQFTEVVAKFEASTDVSAEKSAEGLGRVAQLTGTAASEYENLASAIYQTGVTSVATESQILSTATQIATAGDLAGFANHEIVALASAFASLNIAPERSRGSVQRIFGEITASVGEGGEALENFATVSGMTVEAFATAWQRDPQVAFTAFVDGLGRVQQAGGDTNAMLKELGIGAVRDIQALQALANNSDVYAQALRETTQAYADGTALSDGYAVATDNVADKTQLLINNLKMMVIQSQEVNGSALKVMLDLLNNIAQGFNNFLSTGVGKGIATIVSGMVALVGVIAAVRAGTALMTASYLGMMQVQYQMNKTTTAGNVSMSQMVKTMASLLLGRRTDAAATATQTAAQNAQNVSLNAGTAALGRHTAATAGANTAALTWGGALRSTGAMLARGGLWGAGIGLGVMLLGEIGKAFRSAEDKAEDFLGTFDGLSDAIKKDSASDYQGEVYGRLTHDLEVNTTSVGDNKDALRDMLGVQEETAGKIDGTAGSLENLTNKFGENTKEWMLNQLLTGESADALEDWRKEFSTVVNEIEGFDMGKVIEASLDPASGGVEAFINDSLVPLRDELDKLVEKGNTGVALTDQEFVRKADLTDQILGLQKLGEAFGNVTIAVTDASEKIERTSFWEGAFGLEEVTDAADDAADGIENLNNTFKDYVDTAFGSVNAAYAMEGSLAALGESLYKNGSAFDEFSVGGRNNMAALEKAVSDIAVYAGDDVDVFTSNVTGLMAMLEEYGANANGELDFLTRQLMNIDGANANAQVNVSTAVAQQNLAALEQRAIYLEERLARVNALESSSRRLGERITLSAQLAVTKNLQAAHARVGTSTQRATKSTASNLSSVTRGFSDAAKGAAKTASGAGKAAKNTKDLAKNAKEAAKELRYVTDYASDISTVLNRAFDIQFGFEISKDNLTSAYQALEQRFIDAGDAAKAARLQIQELNAEILGIKAENSTLEWKMRIAINHGDQKRAEDLQAQIAKNDANIAGLNSDKSKANKELRNATDILTANLKGNSAAAIENRKALQDIVKANNEVIVAMAASGYNQKQINAYINGSLIPTFKKEVTQVGMNQKQYQSYTKQVADARIAINSIPRNVSKQVDVKVNGKGNVDSMRTSINELKNKTVTATTKVNKSATDNFRKANTGGRGISSPITVPVRTAMNTNDIAKVGRGFRLLAQLQQDYARLQGYMRNPLGNVGRIASTVVSATNKASKLASNNYWAGGFTGRGGKYEYAGDVHKGEYVLPKEGVNQSTGLPDLNYVASLMPKTSADSYTNYNTNQKMIQAVQQQGIQLVEIDHNQVRQIVEATLSAGNIVLSPTAITSAVNAVNQNNTNRNNA